jgi:hypothetical protein
MYHFLPGMCVGIANTSYTGDVLDVRYVHSYTYIRVCIVIHDLCYDQGIRLASTQIYICQNLGASNRTPVQTRQDTIDVDRC